MKITYKKGSLPRWVVIIIFSFLFIYRFFGERYDFFQLRYLFSAILIIFAILLYSVSKNKKKYIVESKITIRFIAPYIIMFFWAILQHFIVGADVRLAFVQFYRIVLILGVSCALFILFKDDAKYIILEAMLITYTVTLITGILSVGIGGFIEYLLSPTAKIVKDNLARYFEVHDLTFALGIYLLYFVLFIEKKTKKDLVLIFICIAYVYFGYKRIELIAIGLTYLMFLFARKRQIQFKVKFAVIALMLAVCVYIVISSTNILSIISMMFGINTEGRLSFYSQMSGVMKLSPDYLGHGLGYVSDYIKDISFGSQGNVTMTRMHNDLLMLYIELGFIPFIFWLYYYVALQTNHFIKQYGNRIGLLYFVLMLYLVVTYATDNTLYYFMTQASFCSIIISECRTYYLKRELDA